MLAAGKGQESRSGEDTLRLRNCNKMAFVGQSVFLGKPSLSRGNDSLCVQGGPTKFMVAMNAEIGGGGKKPSRNRRFRPGVGKTVEKTKLEAETVFVETGPSNLELVVPTLAILTVIGIIPFVAAVARAAWVRYKITSRRISISSGFQGKDQTEIIYRDIEKLKYINRLGGAADCVITLKDGAKVEIRAVPEFEKIYEYILEKLDEKARDASGAA